MTKALFGLVFFSLFGCEPTPNHPTPVDHRTPPPAVNSQNDLTGSGGSYGQYDHPGQLPDPSHQKRQ